MSPGARTEREVVLCGTVSDIDRSAGSFLLQPVYGFMVRASASEGILDEIDRALHEGGDDARLMVRGIGVFRINDLESLMRVDAVRLVVPTDIPAQLDELRNLKDGWADGIQHPSDWGSGYGKAPSHEGLDWLGDTLEREYPDHLPLPRIYPTPEGGVQMEWTLGRIDISLEIDLRDHTGYWHWVDVNDFDKEGEKALDLDDSDSWAWIAAEIRRLEESPG